MGPKFGIEGNRLKWKDTEVTLANDLDLNEAKIVQRDSAHREGSHGELCCQG